MRFVDYIKDHGMILAVDIIAVIIVDIFMRAFNMPSGLRIAVTLIFVLACSAGLLWNFARKRKYYNTMQENLGELDQKYLIAETLEDPDFYEGKLMNDMIREMETSMYLHVGEAKRYAGDFKEYIEMWVHEVKLPVAGLLLRVNNLREELAGEAEAAEGKLQRIAELDEAETQLRRINYHIEQVLYYARSENAEKDYIIRNTKLGRAVSSVLQANRSNILERNITLNVHDLNRTVVTDSKWLEFILGQFLSNSIRYTAGKAAPAIEIFSEEKDSNTILHFKDNGTGIPAQDLSRIWDKAFTGTNGRSDGELDKGYFGSTGMGLYIVKKLCDKLGHRASVDSVYGEYTDFMIIFGKNDIFRV